MSVCVCVCECVCVYIYKYIPTVKAFYKKLVFGNNVVLIERFTYKEPSREDKEVFTLPMILIINF